MCTVRSPAFNGRRPGLCQKTMVKPVKFSRVWKEWRGRAASMRRGDTFDPWLDPVWCSDDRSFLDDTKKQMG